MESWDVMVKGEGRRGNAKSSFLHFREPLSHFLSFFSLVRLRDSGLQTR